MKKTTMVVLAVLLALTGMTGLHAQRLGMAMPSASIQSQATFGTFTNVLDAAVTINEAATDIAFSKIGRSYFFGGIAANPNWVNLGASSGAPIFGYYHAGERPWSIFGRLQYTGPGVTESITVAEPGITRQGLYRGFKDLNTNLQFLINLGAVSTGVMVRLNFTDNKIVSNTQNVIITSGGNKVENITMALTSDIGFYAPIYFESAKMKHYIEAGVGATILDQSVKVTTNGTVTTDNPLVSATTSPMAIYKGALQLGPNDNQLSIFGGFAIPITSLTNTTGLTPGFDLDIGAYYSMNFNPFPTWLKFKLEPGAEYFLQVAPSTTASSSVTNTIALTLNAGMEIKPEKWPFGFMIGSRGEVSFAGKVVTSGTVTKTEAVTNTWTTEIMIAGGIFIPLPNDFRLDLTLASGANLLQLDKIALQLIVPLK